MFEKIRGFWQRFLYALQKTQTEKVPPPAVQPIQTWQDFARVNLLNVAIVKINNLVNTEATFDVLSDSVRSDVETMKELCTVLESKRYEITGRLLADGDFFVFPTTDRIGNICNCFIPQSQVRIVKTDVDKIVEAYAIIDIFITDKNAYFFLLRKHELDENGDLTISYEVVDEKNQPANVPKWDSLNGVAFKFTGANHIGFGRYKSPVDSRGTSPVYGVPLNFGCQAIEKDIFDDFSMYKKEFENAGSKLFVPDTIGREIESRNGKEIKLLENIYTYSERSGQAPPTISIYSPQIREEEYAEKINSDLKKYEDQIGVNRGILTEPDHTTTATATEVRRANKDTLALINKIRTSIDAGNRDTLAADAIFVNVPADVWTYSSDWYDPFEDADGQWQRLLQAQNVGAIGKDKLTSWLLPDLSPEEVKSMLEDVKHEQDRENDEAIERILMGQ